MATPGGQVTCSSPSGGQAPDPGKARGALSEEIDGLVYVLTAVPSASSRARTVVTVRLATSATAGPPPLVERLDLFSSRARRAFAELVAQTFGRESEVILGHLAVVLERCERASVEAKPPAGLLLSAERRAVAEKLLASPDLLERAARAMEALGHVGEENTKRLAFLVGLSRLLAKPLSALLVAPSGSGKSAVLEMVLALTPPEHVVVSSRLTAGSLYHAGPDALRHKLVVVDEFDGQLEALHAIRVLQSRGSLALTTTARGKAETFEVHGPIAVMSGTTCAAIDPQNTSRCLELSLDDSPEQTRLVHEAQARAWAGKAPVERPDLEVWHDSQRLLAEEMPVAVVVPFAEQLSFPTRATTDRRSSAKVLGLIAAHALLHARQRERDTAGRVVATVEDYAVVHELMAPVLDNALDGLSARATELYRALGDLPEPFTRRAVSGKLAWSYMTIKRAFDELVAQELVRVAPGAEKPVRYRLLDRSLLASSATLTPPETLSHR